MLTRFDNQAIAAAAVLFACGSSAAQIKVALCGATATSSTTCQWTDVQTKLMATGQFSVVDIVNVTTTGGGTPTLQQLGQYDALLCWTNVTPANNVTWGDVLADYVDQGGGVVVAVFANSAVTAGRNIGGRWQSGYEVILDQGGNTSGTLATLGTVHQPGHPVMTGVVAFSGGTSSFRPTATALEVGSSLVASWSDGKVLVAQGVMPNRVDLGFFPPSSACTATYWSTGGDLLMANALTHVAGFAAYHTYGAGCPGTLGVPTLAALLGSRPVAGGTFQVRVSNAPFGLALMVLGFSDDQSGGIPLPLDLSLINMPGCSLLAEIYSSEFVAGVPPNADWSLPIPLVVAFLGVNFFNQAGVFDPGVNPMGLTVTNGGRGRIGF